jgi:tight adherence protein B
VIVLMLGWIMRSAGPETVALAVILVVALIPAIALFRRQRKGRAESEVADRVLETTELLAAELAAGLPPGVALQHAAHSWSTLQPVAEAERLGASVPSAWRAIAEQNAGAGDLRLVGAGWDAALRTGGGLAEATARVASSIRANRASARVIASELASARATSRLVAGLPIAALLMGTSEDSHPVQFLFADPVGLACLAGGLAFGLVGLWWIEAIAGGVHR